MNWLSKSDATYFQFGIFLQGLIRNPVPCQFMLQTIQGSPKLILFESLAQQQGIVFLFLHMHCDEHGGVSLWVFPWADNFPLQSMRSSIHH
jgi:hypothetical protein